MFILIAVYLLLIDGSAGTFITLRDPDFTGEDKHLKKLLAQRINVNVDLSVYFNPNETIYLHELESILADEKSYINETSHLNESSHVNETRHTNETDYRRASANMSKPLRYRRQFEKNRKYKAQETVLDVMRHSIYRTRDRMKSYERIIKKYENNPLFRLGYVFSKLDQWEKEMRMIYKKAGNDTRNLPKFGFQISYYEHLVRRHVDVTYTMQYLYHAHAYVADLLRKTEDVSAELSDRDLLNKEDYKAIIEKAKKEKEAKKKKKKG